VGGSRGFESPYISLTDDPGHAFTFDQYRSEQHIFIINAAKLRRMNIYIKPTTVLADRWGIKYKGQGHLHFVTGSHWLARFWIPTEYNAWKVSFPDFIEAYITSGIVDSI
jgi:hypothetical protein